MNMSLAIHFLHARTWFGLCFIILSVEGQTVTLEGSTSAVRGSSYQFTCTVTGGTLGLGLTFVRGTGIAPDTPCVVRTGSQCREHTSDNGYSCACVSGQTWKFYLTIASVSLHDDNSWQCQYSAVVSNTISLDVIYPPSITSVPSNKDVTENTSPNIDCSSNITLGKPSSTSYGWTGPGGYSKSGALLDRTVTRTQGGQYSSTATNTAGLSDTAQVNINVQYRPSITSVPSNKDVMENTSPNIDCSSNITPGNPSSTSYRWSGPGGYSKTGAVLDRTVIRTQGGQYTCNATNTAGLSYTAHVNINVQYPPTITSVPSNKDVSENTSPNIDCGSNITPGNPSSTRYRWTGPGGYSQTSAVFDRTVTRIQGGQYTCTATNTAGLLDTARININVQYPPSIISVPSIVYVTENTSHNIDCSADITPGNPSSTSYRWTGPGGYNTTGAILGRAIRKTEEGLYTCTATNTVGLSDTARVNIRAITSPLAPTSFEVEVMGGTFVMLKWTSKFNGGADQLFHIEYQDARSYIKSLGIADPGRGLQVLWNITRLEPESSYSLSLYSENISGRSESVELNVTTIKSSKEQKAVNNGSCGIGPGLGIGFGICLPIIALLIIGGILFVRRQKDHSKNSKETTETGLHELDVQPVVDSTVSERTYSTLHHDANDGSQYEKIQSSQNISDVHVYENPQ